MEETIEKAELPMDEDEETDSDCPWCGGSLYQGPESRYCADCPFYAKYPADLSDAPPYIVRAYADWQEERMLEASKGE